MAGHQTTTDNIVDSFERVYPGLNIFQPRGVEIPNSLLDCLESRKAEPFYRDFVIESLLSHGFLPLIIPDVTVNDQGRISYNIFLFPLSKAAPFCGLKNCADERSFLEWFNQCVVKNSLEDAHIVTFPPVMNRSRSDDSQELPTPTFPEVLRRKIVSEVYGKKYGLWDQDSYSLYGHQASFLIMDKVAHPVGSLRIVLPFLDRPMTAHEISINPGQVSFHGLLEDEAIEKGDAVHYYPRNGSGETRRAYVLGEFSELASVYKDLRGFTTVLIVSQLFSALESSYDYVQVPGNASISWGLSASPTFEKIFGLIPAGQEKDQYDADRIIKIQIRASHCDNRKAEAIYAFRRSICTPVGGHRAPERRNSEETPYLVVLK